LHLVDLALQILPVVVHHGSDRAHVGGGGEIPAHSRLEQCPQRRQQREDRNAIVLPELVEAHAALSNAGRRHVEVPDTVPTATALSGCNYWPAGGSRLSSALNAL